MKAVILLALVAFAAAANNVVVKGLRLFDGNEEFFIKSMCYSPAPIGYEYNKQEGVGVCKQRTQYRIDNNLKELITISACYYEDFFDGSIDPETGRPWFESVWKRDLPAIAASGANTVRMYHTNPITAQAVFSDDGYPFKGYGSEYRPFMDAAAANGLKVVFPLFAELTQILSFSTEKMEEYIRNLVDNVGDHPALLMWQFGNELPLSDPTLGPQIIPKLNHFFDYARTWTYLRYNRVIPVSIALVDLPSQYNSLSTQLKVDIITTNAGYRGPTYSDLWVGNNGDFSGLHKLSCQTGKPVFIGEIGQHSSDQFVNMNDWFTQNWAAIEANYNSGAIGGALFEYSNEAWKADNQRNMGVVAINADNSITYKTNGGAYDFNAVKSAWTPNFFGTRTKHTLDNVDNAVCSQYGLTPANGPLYGYLSIPAPAPINPYPYGTTSSSTTSTPTNNGGTPTGGSGNTVTTGSATPTNGASTVSSSAVAGQTSSNSPANSSSATKSASASETAATRSPTTTAQLNNVATQARQQGSASALYAGLAALVVLAVL